MPSMIHCLLKDNTISATHLNHSEHQITYMYRWASTRSLIMIRRLCIMLSGTRSSLTFAYSISQSAPGESVGSNIDADTSHLRAIVQRINSRLRSYPVNANQSTIYTPLMAYHPSSLKSFLDRLATFSLASYTPSNHGMSAVEAARCGWISGSSSFTSRALKGCNSRYIDGLATNSRAKNRLLCPICFSSWTVADVINMERDAEIKLVQKQRSNMVTMHKDGCPWGRKQCDGMCFVWPLYKGVEHYFVATLYTIPMSPRLEMTRNIVKAANRCRPHLHGVKIQSPLVCLPISQVTVCSLYHRRTPR
jgi:hypothetical protein